MKVVLAGSRTLPLALTARHLLVELLKLPGDSQILLRGPKSLSRKPGAFEILASQLATLLNIAVEWHMPEGSQRSQTFLRDLTMVEAADYVVAFFSPDAIMEGGTGHVVEAAWSKMRSVRAFTIDDDGDLLPIGEYDPVMDAT